MVWSPTMPRPAHPLPVALLWLAMASGACRGVDTGGVLGGNGPAHDAGEKIQAMIEDALVLESDAAESDEPASAPDAPAWDASLPDAAAPDAAAPLDFPQTAEAAADLAAGDAPADLPSADRVVVPDLGGSDLPVYPVCLLATCPAPANAHPICKSDHCDFVCDAGYKRVGDTCSWRGDIGCCGDSCSTCIATRSNAAPACDGTSCVTPSPCRPTYHECHGGCVSDTTTCN
jgi:hypothetical protein